MTIGGEQLDQPKSQGERVRKALSGALLGLVVFGVGTSLALYDGIGQVGWLYSPLGLVAISGLAMVLAGLGLAARHFIRG